MKTLSTRELRLSLITAAVMILGLSWLILESQLTQLSGLDKRDLNAQVAARQQEDLLGLQPELLEKLTTIKGQLPRHQEGEDLKSDFARQVQSLANLSGLRLTGLTPDTEVYLEDLDLYQSAVRCNWSGSSENLVTFLHRLNAQGAVADIRELRLRNRSGEAAELSGSFILDFVYSRVPALEPEPVIDTSPESVDTPPSP